VGGEGIARPTVAVLGLGEAGGRLAGDLAAAGADVRGYDPAGIEVPRVTVVGDVPAAVRGCDVVLSLNNARVALDVATAAFPALAADAVYGDLNTGSPELKQEITWFASDAGRQFADVALLGPVPGRGLATPALVSGPGAQTFADRMRPLGMPVTFVSDRSGDAAGMKLIRSVFMKGLAAAAVESVAAAEAAGHEAWLKQEIAAVIGEPFLERLLDGSRRHAARRTEEMEAARDLLTRLGVEPRIADASGALLRSLSD
jgi:3-hydroxyisobutyrate dehydrogenase-like beta-hydroxyacid dehydrogenase